MTPLLAQGSRLDRSFERLYRRHVRDVYHYALAVLRNPSDAEDVTQTTFLNAYRAYERGERPSAEQNWLIAIAHNVCRQRFRQAARRPQEVAFDEDVGEAIVPEEAPSAHDIQKALGHLAFNQRAALVMRELEGRTYAEIAEILGLSVGAVETLIFRARRALREQLEGSLTCREAELATSRQLDGRLPRAERGPLRAHLRECRECASFARSQRAQRAALKALSAIPLPASLSSFFGGGGAAAVGTGVAAKAALVVAAGALAGGLSYEGVRHPPFHAAAEHAKRTSAPAARASVAPPARADGAELRPPTRLSAGKPVAEVAAANENRGQGVAKAKGKRKGKGIPAAVGDAAAPGQAVPPGQSRAVPRGRARGHQKPKSHPARVKPASHSHPPHPAAPPQQKPDHPSSGNGNGGNGNNGNGGGNPSKGTAPPPIPNVQPPAVTVPTLPLPDLPLPKKK